MPSTDEAPSTQPEEKEARPWYLAVAIPLSILFVVMSLVWIVFSSREPDFRPGQDLPAPPAGAVVTLENYNRLEDGMSYERVSEILGGPGTIVSESSNTRIARWKGTKGGRRSINGVFRNGKLSGKSQVGLE